jgi:hypothetical protein
MNVLDLGADLRYFVCSTMKDRDLVPALAQAVREKRSAGTRATDNQSALHGLLILAYLWLPLMAGANIPVRGENVTPRDIKPVRGLERAIRRCSPAAAVGGHTLQVLAVA